MSLENATVFYYYFSRVYKKGAGCICIRYYEEVCRMRDGAGKKLFSVNKGSEKTIILGL